MELIRKYILDDHQTNREELILELENLKQWLTECSNKCPVCREEVCKGMPRM